MKKRKTPDLEKYLEGKKRRFVNYTQGAKIYKMSYYSIHLVIIVYSYLLFCYTPFKKQFWRIRNATLSCYTY